MAREIFGVSVTPLRMGDLVDSIVRPASAQSRVIFTMNLDHVVQMQRNPRFRDAYAAADVVTIDGAPVLAYAKARGAEVEKISGADLFHTLIPQLDPKRHRLFLVLSSERLCDMMRARLRDLGFAADNLAFAVPPFGFEYDLESSRDLAVRVRAFRPTHLFFCVGAPKSEIWCARHRDAIGTGVAICVGASAEFYLGVKKRAPLWIQRVGGEWLWRWGQEPRRLFRRYFVTSWAFLGAIWGDVRSDEKRGRTRLPAIHR